MTIKYPFINDQIMAHLILIADDDRDDRLFLRDAFEEVGLSDDIYIVENGLCAILYLDGVVDDDDLPGIIVLDLDMPILDGIETLTSIKANPRYKNIPVIIHSSSIDPVEKTKCLLSGAAFFLPKSTSFNQYLFNAMLMYEWSRSHATA